MVANKRLLTVEDKVRVVVNTILPDFGYLFMDYTQANVEFDKMDRPSVMYVLPPSGSLLYRRDSFRDRPKTQIWFLCPSDFDFDGHDNDRLIERMKLSAMKFFVGLNKSGLFRQIDGALPYQVAYDAFDLNMTGICFELELEELDGVKVCDGNIVI